MNSQPSNGSSSTPSARPAIAIPFFGASTTDPELVKPAETTDLDVSAWHHIAGDLAHLGPVLLTVQNRGGLFAQVAPHLDAAPGGLAARGCACMAGVELWLARLFLLRAALFRVNGVESHCLQFIDAWEREYLRLTLLPDSDAHWFSTLLTLYSARSEAPVSVLPAVGPAAVPPLHRLTESFLRLLPPGRPPVFDPSTLIHHRYEMIEDKTSLGTLTGWRPLPAEHILPFLTAGRPTGPSWVWFFEASYYASGLFRLRAAPDADGWLSLRGPRTVLHLDSAEFGPSWIAPDGRCEIYDRHGRLLAAVSPAEARG